MSDSDDSVSTDLVYPRPDIVDNASNKSTELQQLQIKSNHYLDIENSDKKESLPSIDGNVQYSATQYYSIWFIFFIIGSFNNLGYVVILSAAKSLADCFNESNLIGVEQWALISIAFIAQIINAFYLENISHQIRGYIVAIMFLIGFILLSISVYINFWFAILAILFIGSATALGESVILGYIKLFPPKVTGAWSSGTGMAGLGGTGLYLLLSDPLHLSNELIFIITIPTCIIYIFCIKLSWNSELRKPWKALNKQRTKSFGKYGKDDDKKTSLLSGVTSFSNAQIASQMTTDVNWDYNELMNNDKNDTILNDTKWIQIKRIFHLTWYRYLMLLLVYMFEYICYVGLAQIANTNRNKDKQDEYYIILGLCYQFGVFISRSSLSIIKIPYFGVMAILQFINVIIWSLQAEYNILYYQSIEYALMVYVGLLGGAMYVNIAYSILSDKHINNRDRELAVNLMVIAIGIGITGASLYELLMDNTFFEHLVDKSSGSSGSGCSTI